MASTKNRKLLFAGALLILILVVAAAAAITFIITNKRYEDTGKLGTHSFVILYILKEIIAY